MLRLRLNLRLFVNLTIDLTRSRRLCEEKRLKLRSLRKIEKDRIRSEKDEENDEKNEIAVICLYVIRSIASIYFHSNVSLNVILRRTTLNFENFNKQCEEKSYLTMKMLSNLKILIDKD